MASKVVFPVTNSDEANELLTKDPLALVLGMLLDQQVPMEWAFRSPHTVKERLGEAFDAPSVAAMDVEQVVDMFCAKPAVHRYPAAMARRFHELCIHVTSDYGGDPAKIWKGVRSGEKLYERVRALPGFGEEKSQIFVALLAKRFGRRPPGWESVAGAFADEEPRSVADISSSEAFTAVRAWKKAQKAARKSKSEFSLK